MTSTVPPSTLPSSSLTARSRLPLSSSWLRASAHAARAWPPSPSPPISPPISISRRSPIRARSREIRACSSTSSGRGSETGPRPPRILRLPRILHTPSVCTMALLPMTARCSSRLAKHTIGSRCAWISPRARLIGAAGSTFLRARRIARNGRALSRWTRSIRSRPFEWARTSSRSRLNTRTRPLCTPRWSRLHRGTCCTMHCAVRSRTSKRAWPARSRCCSLVRGRPSIGLRSARKRCFRSPWPRAASRAPTASPRWPPRALTAALTARAAPPSCQTAARRALAFRSPATIRTESSVRSRAAPHRSRVPSRASMAAAAASMAM